jgi:hypothetical protein
VHAVVFRTLKREYRLHLPSAAIAESLRFITAEPELPGLVLEQVDMQVAERHGFLTVRLPSGHLIEGTPGHLLGAMHRLAMADLIEGDPDAPFIHGATVVVEGRRLLLIGHKGCGKSTLALHLALNGYAVEGDEHLVVRESQVIARPRTMRIKEGSLTVVASVPDRAWTAPSVLTWDGGVIRALGPDIGGVPWCIRAGRLDAIVCLRANHGGSSVSHPMASGKAFERMMREVILHTGGVAAGAGRLRRLAFGVPSFELLLGNLAAAEWHLRTLARQLT